MLSRMKIDQGDIEGDVIDEFFHQLIRTWLSWISYSRSYSKTLSFSLDSLLRMLAITEGNDNRFDNLDQFGSV
jgi:hypothetical protein